MSSRIKIHRTQLSEKVVGLAFEGRLDIHSLEAFREVFNKEFECNNYNIILDLSEVSFIISTYVGLILSFQKSVKKNNGNISLAGLSTEVGSIFELMGITDLIGIYGSVESAMELYTN
tara:strand:+ start:1739 stop:2092 length:354 start_codon:yes stop_codon:yes gene_type:complete